MLSNTVFTSDRVVSVYFKEILKDLSHRLALTSQSAVIVGVGMIGKTSLIRYLTAYGLKSLEPQMPIYLQIDAARYSIEDGDAHKFWTEIWRLLAKELDISDSTKSTSTPFELILDVAETGNRKIVILIDNLDCYLRIAENTDLRKFRSITDSPLVKNIMFIATTSEEITSVIKNNEKLILSDSPFHNFYVYYLLPMERQDLKAFLKEFDTGLTKDEFNLIYEMSGGHPYLVKLVLEQIRLRKSSANLSLDRDQFNKLRLELQINEKVVWLCTSIYQRLIPSQKQAINKIASNGFEEGSIEALDTITQKLIDQVGILRRENSKILIFSHLFYLVIQDEIKKNTVHNRKPLDVPVQVGGAKKTEASGNLYFKLDSRGRNLKINGKEIVLTKLEGQLFEYLVSHKNTICTKKELLLNVWSPSRSPSVVERGINRLRNKIETNPSIPQFLVTLKGKGYMLVDKTSNK